MKPEERDAFERWWRASKYCQVVMPVQAWEQIARDAWNAATAQSPAGAPPEPTADREELLGDAIRALIAGRIECSDDLPPEQRPISPSARKAFGCVYKFVRAANSAGVPPEQPKCIDEYACMMPGDCVRHGKCLADDAPEAGVPTARPDMAPDDSSAYGGRAHAPMGDSTADRPNATPGAAPSQEAAGVPTTEPVAPIARELTGKMIEEGRAYLSQIIGCGGPCGVRATDADVRRLWRVMNAAAPQAPVEPVAQEPTRG